MEEDKTESTETLKYSTIIKMTAFNQIAILVFLSFMFCVPFSTATATATEMNNGNPFEESEEDTIDLTNIDTMSLKNLTQDEQEWYKRFQNGLMFFDGWKQISSEILEAVSPDEQDQARFLLETIGVKIGTEWCRDNDVRRIDTDQLRSWGKRLRKDKKENPAILTDTLKIIAREVDAILVE